MTQLVTVTRLEKRIVEREWQLEFDVGGSPPLVCAENVLGSMVKGLFGFWLFVT